MVKRSGRSLCGGFVIVLAVTWVLALTWVAAASCTQVDSLVEVATSPRQWTGIAVSKVGRVFVCFPRWSEGVPISVGELDSSGAVHAYPTDELNSWKVGDDPGEKFVCVQSVYVDGKDRLWILDPASPMFQGVVKGGPKLVRVDLKTDKPVRRYHFDEAIAPKGSYLNDVRIDTATETAFITDSGLGAMVVLDLKTGAARRVLENHPSTKAEDIQIVIAEKPFPIVVHSDGVALDQNGGWLYYQALTGKTMYRVTAAALRDDSLSADELASKVERFAESGVSDGLLFGPGGVYVSALEENSIKLVNADGEVTRLATDPRLLWPDSFSPGSDGSIWFTTSQIHLGPNPPSPYRIFKLDPKIHSRNE